MSILNERYRKKPQSTSSGKEVYGPQIVNSSLEQFVLPNGNLIAIGGIGARLAESVLKGEPFDRTGIKKGSFKVAYKRLMLFMRQAGYDLSKGEGGIIQFEPHPKSNTIKNLPVDEAFDMLDQNTKVLNADVHSNLAALKRATNDNPAIVDNNTLGAILLMGEAQLGGRLIITGCNSRSSQVYFEKKT